jgi:hypothetical protein
MAKKDKQNKGKAEDKRLKITVALNPPLCAGWDPESTPDNPIILDPQVVAQAIRDMVATAVGEARQRGALVLGGQLEPEEDDVI